MDSPPDKCSACGSCHISKIAHHGLDASGRLFYWASNRGLGARIREKAVALGLSVGEDDETEAVCVELPSLSFFLLSLARAFELPLLETVRALFLSGKRPPTLRDLSRVEPLGCMTAQAEGIWLRRLIHEQRLQTYFQPIFSLSDPDLEARIARPFAHECLSRGLDRDGTLIAPASLFDIAARSSQTHRLDDIARRTALYTAAREGLEGRVFVNFLPGSIYDPAFNLESTRAIINAAGLDARKVVFEVVETERVEDPRHLVGAMKSYTDAGFQIALDDIGGGYSSLTLLATLRPTFVKIDRALVDGVASDPAKAAIIKGLTATAQELGIKIIAEGLEKSEDVAWLRECHVDYGQGFLFAHPEAVPFRPVERPAAE